MAIRPIDAVQVLNDINWHHKPTPVSEFESGFNQGLNQAMWIITHAPTLPQPNEPLTLEHLRASPHGKIKDSTLQSICNRANEIACRPPEGET